MILSWSQHTPVTPSLEKARAPSRVRPPLFDGRQNADDLRRANHGPALPQTTVLVRDRSASTGFILKRSFHTELWELRLISRFVLKATGSEVALEHSECTPVEAVVQIVMLICFTPLLRARHRCGGGAFVARRQCSPRWRSRQCRKALTPPLPPAGASRLLFSL
jgi:hypothetical protein